MRVVIGQRRRFADETDLHIQIGEPGLAQARIDERCFFTRIGADQKDGVRFFDSRNAGVEEIPFPHSARSANAERRAFLPAVHMRRANRDKEIAQRLDRLGWREIADDPGNPIGRCRFDLVCNDAQGFIPRRRLQLAIDANKWPVEPLPFQTIPNEPRLVGDPFFVDPFMQSRQDPHHIATATIDADIRSNRVHDIDRLGLGQLPRASVKGVGLRGQRAHRAHINQIARQFAFDCFLKIGGDFRILTAVDEAEIIDAGDLRGETHAARALNTPGHDRF